MDMLPTEAASANIVPRTARRVNAMESCPGCSTSLRVPGKALQAAGQPEKHGRHIGVVGWITTGRSIYAAVGVATSLLKD